MIIENQHKFYEEHPIKTEEIKLENEADATRMEDDHFDFVDMESENFENSLKEEIEAKER